MAIIFCKMWSLAASNFNVPYAYSTQAIKLLHQWFLLTKAMKTS